MSTTAPLPLTLLDLDAVLSCGPYRCRTMLYAAIRKKKWPQPVRFGGRSLWKSTEVAEAIARAVAEAEAVSEEGAQRRVEQRREAGAASVAARRARRAKTA